MKMDEEDDEDDDEDDEMMMRRMMRKRRRVRRSPQPSLRRPHPRVLLQHRMERRPTKPHPRETEQDPRQQGEKKGLPKPHRHPEFPPTMEEIKTKMMSSIEKGVMLPKVEAKFENYVKNGFRMIQDLWKWRQTVCTQGRAGGTPPEPHCAPSLFALWKMSFRNFVENKRRLWNCSARGWRFWRANREELWMQSGSAGSESLRDFWNASCCSWIISRFAC
ncbi:hypothetical protein JZ751_018423 [Albula glossodonta]|uniref:Nucleophosmin n=1 Tax=Albula glossodonta TaxID=121402 RepID=A0A8T2MR86_9TELE|nr:hypothetical protein JZ751_018423 [Albula glossodonta]